MAPAYFLRVSKPTSPRQLSPRAAGVPPRATHNQRTAAKPFRPLSPHKANALQNKTQRAGQPTLSGILPPPAVSPFGQGASRPAGRLHTQTGAPPPHPWAGSRPTPLPSLTHSKTRPTQTHSRRNTSTLRRSGSSGKGRAGLQPKAPRAVAPLLYLNSMRRNVSRLTAASPPTPEALRPPQLLSNR